MMQADNFPPRLFSTLSCFQRLLLLTTDSAFYTYYASTLIAQILYPGFAYSTLQPVSTALQQSYQIHCQIHQGFTNTLLLGYYSTLLSFYIHQRID